MIIDDSQHYPINLNDLPIGWEAVYVGDVIASIQPGFPSGRHNKDGLGVPHLRPFNIDRLGRLDVSELKYIPADADRARIALGDVMFNNTNSPELIGKTTVVSAPGEWAFSNHMTRLRPPAGLSPWFIAYQLHYLWMTGYFRHRCTHHVNQASISSSTLADSVPLVVAPTREQDRIVSEIEKQLTRLDAAVAALKRVQANLKRYRAAVLKAACEGRLVPTEAEFARKEGRDYETGEQLLARILNERRAKWEADQLARMTAAGKPPKDDSWKRKYKEPEPPNTSNLPPLPEGWTWASMDQLAWYIRNGISTKPSAPAGVPILRISAVRPMKLDLMDVRFLDDEPEYQDFQLSKGDLLFTRYNGTRNLVGVAALVPACTGVLLHPDKLIRVRLVSDEPLPSYIEIVSNVGVSRTFVETKIRTTAGQSGVSGADIRNIPIPLCSSAEQSRIVKKLDEKISTLHATETAIASGLGRADRLRQSILKRAFEGKLVPQDPNDEPASALLERIRTERGTKDNPNRGNLRRQRQARATAVTVK
jgi:type I restriction enzyme S subunit